MFGLFLIGITKGRTKLLMIFWTIAMTGFVGAMSAARVDNITPTVYPLITLASISVGAVIIPCSIIAQVVCPTEFIGTVTAITLAIRYIGGAIGFTVYYNVFFHHVTQYVTPQATLAITQGGLMVNIVSIEQVTADTTKLFTFVSAHPICRGECVLTMV